MGLFMGRRAAFTESAPRPFHYLDTESAPAIPIQLTNTLKALM